MVQKLRKKDLTHLRHPLVEANTRVCPLEMKMQVMQVSLEIKVHKMEIGGRETLNYITKPRIGETIPKAGREVVGRIPSRTTMVLVSLVVTKVKEVRVTTNGTLGTITLLETEGATTHKIHGMQHHNHLMPTMAKVTTPTMHPTTKVVSLVTMVKVHKEKVRVNVVRVLRNPSPSNNRGAEAQGWMGCPWSR